MAWTRKLNLRAGGDGGVPPLWTNESSRPTAPISRVSSMPSLRFILVAIAVSAVALYAEVAWCGLGGWPAIRVGTLIDAQWIRAHYPNHLTSPDWIPASGAELLDRWRTAEFCARSALVFPTWLACLLFVFRWARRPGKASHRTALDAGAESWLHA